MTIEILTLIIRLAIAVMTGFCVPAFKSWLETKTENEKLEQLRAAVETAVYAAEQMYGAVDKADPDGDLRYTFAYNTINRVAMRLGFALSSDEIKELIEAAVQELNFYTRHGEG